MEHNEDRDSLKDVPTFILPPPPRFDAAATAAAQPVEPLPNTKGFTSVRLFPKISRLINRRSKLLALMAIIGLATGAAGGMLVVERDRQQRITSSSMVPLTGAQPDGLENATPLGDHEAPASLKPPAESVQAQPTPRRPRRLPRKQLVVFAGEDQDEGDDEDKDKDKAKDNDDDRRRNDQKRDSDDERNDRSRRGAVLYDVLRSRKP